jgi:WhiB family redox-sensing transcriptional regulator
MTGNSSPILTGSWAARAKCAGIENPDIFFPPNGNKGGKALKICAGCPVRAECLEYALNAGEKFGIWGGLGPRERRNLKRSRRRAARASRDGGGAT